VKLVETRNFRIALIRGDGIGPELVESAVEVLDAAVRDIAVLTYHEESGGARTYAQHGYALAPEALNRIQYEYDATLKGPVGLPTVRKPDGTEGGLLGGVLRGTLDTFANVRPIKSVPGVRTAMRGDLGAIDYVIVRENTEGLYMSRDLGVGNDRACADQLLLTRSGVERIVHHAFALAQRREGAPADGVRRVTCVDKSNVLKSYAYFRKIFTEISRQYQDVEADYRYADAAGHDLVHNPRHFNVLVMENFLGDILSDVGTATVGGLGMCPSGNIGDRAAYFEPVHGSAPSIANTGQANPTSEILCAAMLLDHLGLGDAGERIRDAVAAAFGGGEITLDAAGSPSVGTKRVSTVVSAHL
jgi:3-isopropylmalate dehydrogenase